MLSRRQVVDICSRISRSWAAIERGVLGAGMSMPSAASRGDPDPDDGEAD